MSKGIDVSSYQGNIDWKKVKADGIEFAILKVIRKDLTPDTKFEINYKGCENAGVIIYGVYNYSYATTVEKAKIDANKVLAILKDKNCMVWLDVEDNCQKNLGQRLVSIILAYKNIIESSGRSFGVYTGLSFYNSYLKKYSDELNNIPFWIARYPSDKQVTPKSMINILKKPSIVNLLFGWQYSSKGVVNGITGNVDMNEWYSSIEMINYTYKNRYKMKTLHYGDAGSDVQLMQQLLINHNFKTDGKNNKLVADGRFGPITKEILIRWQRYKGLKLIDGICGPDTWQSLID